MRGGGEEEPRAGWEGPRGAEATQANLAHRLRPQPPAPSRRDPLQPSSAPAFTAWGWRRARGRYRPISGESCSGTRPRNPTSQWGRARRNARGVSSLRPPGPAGVSMLSRSEGFPVQSAKPQGQRFPGFTQTSCHPFSPRAPHLRSSGTGRGRAAKGVPAL